MHVALFHLRFVGKAASLLIAWLAFALLIYLGCEVTLASLAFLSPLFSMSRGTQGGGGAGERGHADVSHLTCLNSCVKVALFASVFSIGR